jgi:hypothetical protein
VNLGVLSISQPAFAAGQSELPRFTGFLGCFLESNQKAVADCVYMLWSEKTLLQ